MANRIRTRGAKPAISYAALHNLCNIHTEKKRRQTSKATGKFIEAERIIARRNGQATLLVVLSSTFIKIY
jgi:hypothetical protein